MIESRSFDSTIAASMTYSAGEQVGVDAVGLLRVDVTDSGVGIEHEDQRRVFFGEFTQQFNRNTL